LSGAICLSPVAGKYCGNDMIANGSASTLYHCPGGQDAPASAVQVCDAGCHVSPPGVNDYCEASPGSCRSLSNCNNCVFFARCKKPNLPYGLWSYQNKVAIINSYTPQAGAVAIINTGDSVGHVAYVESVNGSNLTISEGNWPLGSCGQRTGTMQSLRITGFFM
ncbi:MAG: CHAP domain-containing protein, partial [Polyangiaceae bacterium]|nr:CHAP domain-containing protein [Polyangiaceae bacterium]